MAQFLFAITAYLLTPFLVTWVIYFAAKWIARGFVSKKKTKEDGIAKTEKQET
jgi:hypothetical protein